MAYEDRFTKPVQAPAKAGQPHTVTMEDRKRLSVSGVMEVESFDEQTIVLETAMGRLVIRGAALNISRLSTDQGDVSVQGQIDSMHYEESAPRQSLWARLFH